MAAAQETLIPACPLCGRQDAEPYVSLPEFIWVKCQCGLVYKRSGIPATAYKDMGGKGSFGENGYGQRYRSRTRRRIRKSRTQIEDTLQFVGASALSSTPRLLDIGCSLGYTLQAARQLHLNPTGVDVSEIAVEGCRAQGFEAQLAGLEMLPFDDSHFAVVTMKHVLEHTGTPRISIREARRVLHPQGALFIAVPHAGYRKAVKDPQRSRFYRSDSHGGIEHWIYYTPKTLTELLVREGFSVRRVHPLLWHSQAKFARKLVKGMAAPFRALFERTLTSFHIRKEFWLIATPNVLPERKKKSGS